MIDIKLIRENVEEVIAKLETRGKDFAYLREVKAKDEERRLLLVEVEQLKKERNDKSRMVGELKRQKLDASSVLASIGNIGDEIAKLDSLVAALDKEIQDTLLSTPNILDSTVPIGKDESENIEIKKYLEPTKFDFVPLSHYEIGEALDILDFERAAKITGSRFVVYKGLGARLERSLIAFMMDLHSKERGYVEIIPPYIVNRESMTATGQLPKFEEDAYKLVGDDDWFLNPTAEVPTLNMYRGEIIDYNKLPINHCSYTMAFRSEAGSAGRDTRGLIRTHQFNKVELIKVASADTSYDELEKMLLDSEEVLKRLKLPYHVVSLCSGDMGFAMAKTYDIEVWLPSQNAYREIASISNAGDYQARRANIRTRKTKDAKLEYVHTLNGSGLAVGRTLVAILENYQMPDGSVKVPDALVKYMGVEYIK